MYLKLYKMAIISKRNNLIATTQRTMKLIVYIPSDLFSSKSKGQSPKVAHHNNGNYKLKILNSSVTIRVSTCLSVFEIFRKFKSFY